MLTGLQEEQANVECTTEQAHGRTVMELTVGLLYE